MASSDSYSSHGYCMHVDAGNCCGHWILHSYINLRFYIIGRYFLILENVGIGWHECLMQDRHTT
jgi:hypothetical protein